MHPLSLQAWSGWVLVTCRTGALPCPPGCVLSRAGGPHLESAWLCPLWDGRSLSRIHWVVSSLGREVLVQGLPGLCPLREGPSSSGVHCAVSFLGRDVLFRTLLWCWPNSVLRGWRTEAPAFFLAPSGGRGGCAGRAPFSSWRPQIPAT